MIHRKITTFAFIFLAWGLLVGLVYHDTPSNFLRAESGWYLFLSHSDPAVRQDFEKMLLRRVPMDTTHRWPFWRSSRRQSWLDLALLFGNGGRLAC